MNSRSKGLRGEEIAAQYLIEKGYRILDKNVRTPFGEVDIIAEKSGRTVVVEVRQRASSNFGSPEESITRTKLKHMILSAQHLQTQYAGSSFQIDFIGIQGEKITTHLQNIELS